MTAWREKKENKKTGNVSAIIIKQDSEEISTNIFDIKNTVCDETGEYEISLKMTEARDGNPINGDYEVRVSIGIRLLNQNHFYTELLEKDKKQYKNY